MKGKGQKQAIEMLKMQIEGNSIIQIAAAFNLTKGRVSQILKKEENQRLKQLMIDRIAERTADAIYEESTGENLRLATGRFPEENL